MAEKLQENFWQTLGFNIKRKETPESTPSITVDERDDGSITMLNRLGSAYGYAFDSDSGTAVNESQLINQYRKTSMVPEIEYAIDDIINEFASTDANKVVTIDLDDIDGIGKNTRNMIQDEFDHIVKVLKFNGRAYEIIKRWYVDGRLTYHLIVDKDPAKHKKEGIRELKYIDPRKIRKVVVITQEKSENGVILTSVADEFYMFHDNGIDQKRPLGSPATTNYQGVRLAKDSVVQITSGLMDENNKLVLSHLHKAIRPLNQLRSLEDASIIYRLSRAPERRIFYVDVGDLPTGKAEQYVADVMAKYKNKTVYDVNTGQIADDRKFMTMLEDFWMPRRNGSKGTEVVNLPGGQNVGEMTEVNYFLQKLYKALNIPATRLDPASGILLGRQVEISRDEYKFAKFIARLRRRFSELFLQLLERQLIIKGLITPEEWDAMKDFISFEYAADNLFSELKENELLDIKLTALERIAPGAIREFYSDEWIHRNVLRRSQEEMEEIIAQKKKEDAARSEEELKMQNANYTQAVK